MFLTLYLRLPLEIEHQIINQTPLNSLLLLPNPRILLTLPIINHPRSIPPTMENLKARNEQLKNEAVALSTILAQETTNERRQTMLAKLYTILFDEQLSADPQASLALNMILTVKSAVGLANELINSMNSGNISTNLMTPSNLIPNQHNQHLNMGPLVRMVLVGI